MKKIFTIILAAAGTIGAASAQSKHEKNVAYNDNARATKSYDDHDSYGKSKTANYYDSYNSYNEKQQQLERINREYDQKIAFVKNNRRLNRREKERQIKWLQDQRKQEMRQVEYQYENYGHNGDSRSFGHDEHKR